MRMLVSLALAYGWLAQQPPVVLENLGKPMKIAFQCSGDDIHNSGLSCTEEEPCTVYLELTMIEPVGNQLFVIGNIHSRATTLYALLLASSDAGKTWREPVERVRGASLDHLRFVDFEYGWIGGQLLQPLPHDPFVLITTDGGKIWRLRPMFDEQRFGTILAMWFDSRSGGSVVLDRGQSSEGLRYELYESPTGGESWMVREAADRPMRIRRMPAIPLDTGWRIRPDAATRAFRIEKRAGEKWANVASFLFELDPCKPPQDRQIEPPTEPVTPPKTEEPKPEAERPKPTLKRKKQ